MPIRWRALPIAEAMDKAQEQVNLAKQFLDEAKKIVKEASTGDNLPEYILQRMKTLKDDLDYASHRCLNKIEGIRGDIPEDALINERKKLEYGAQQTYKIE